MPVAWPPPSAPVWPPRGYPGLQFSDLAAAQTFAERAGWTVRAATAKEQRDFFVNARCDDGHQVTGALLVAGTVAYPFAVCLGPAGSRVFLVPWGPDFVWGST